MARVTLTTVHSKLQDIESHVRNLEAGKVDKNINKLELKALKLEIKDVKRDVDSMKGLGRWVALLIGGTIITAFMTALISGKFSG